MNRLEKIFGGFAVRNLSAIIVGGQVIAFFLSMSNAAILNHIVLFPILVLDGEIHRLLTFVFQPPSSNIVFAFFGWYLFYLMGTALENHWGTFRYNLFLLIGYLATVSAAFLQPYDYASVAFLGGSVFLAFAYLNPEFTILVFFILPVQIKWLALITWLGYGFGLITGDWMTRLMILSSTINFFVFFGKDIFLTARQGKRRMAVGFKNVAPIVVPTHTCRVCTKTDLTNPDTEFRYCSKCSGQSCYCSEHLFTHDHK